MVGVIIKDIVFFLKVELSTNIIVGEVNTKYNTQLSDKDVFNIKITINDFLNKKEKPSIVFWY